MECPRAGELLALDGGRVTSREIRQLEERVIDVAVRAARGEDATKAAVGAREAGLAVAEAALGEGKQLDREQREAFELLVGESGWVCLTGRAGTGKGPTLHAAAETYRAAGWQVIACAMDGTTARRMADQLGGQASALTIEQLKVRLVAGSITVDGRTVIFVDEASKLDTGHWGELAKTVERHGAKIRAVGHDGQHEAIRLSGLFSEMLRQRAIPTVELRQIRRHRDPQNPAHVHPWLCDYQIAVDEGRGTDAVAILQEHQALKLYDTRAQAMGGMVDDWNSWRRDYEPGDSAMIVHGPNSDVDLVNELAQQKRLEAGELGEQAIRAVDCDYLLHPGDVVAVRDAAYTFHAPPGHERPKRVENGQVAVVEAVDPKRDTLTLLVREPGSERRRVEIDQARLRAQHASGKRTTAVRLNYAIHSFPAQGATVNGTATLAGHWSQAKQETYVGDTRAIYRHTVHIAREDLGTNGTDQERVHRYAQRISDNRQRQASIRSELAPTLQLSVRLPDQQSIPGHVGPRTDSTSPLGGRPHQTCEAPDVVNGRRQQSAGVREQTEHAPAGRPEHLIHALGPRPEERIAQERWERQARRLDGLPHQTSTETQPPMPIRPQLSTPRAPAHAPAVPAPAAPQRDRLGINR
jgi:hypothetical protein